MHLKQHMTDELLIVLWLGILTGAMLVSLVFTYGVIQNQALESSILRSSVKTKSVVEVTMPNEVKTSAAEVTMPNE